MRIRLLGTAAGGGFPQWNCNCTNCYGVRHATLPARSRTQSSVAISADDQRWFILNASPDIRSQICAFPALVANQELRKSSIEGILLTDADLDHTLGLFTLREGDPLTVYASLQVQHALAVGLAISGVLEHYSGINWQEAASDISPLRYTNGVASRLNYVAHTVAGKPPRYMQDRAEPHAGDQVGYYIVDEETGGRLLYLPGLANFSETTLKYMQMCDVLLLDGTFWSETEMQQCGVGTTTATQMGHMPVGEPTGSLTILQNFPQIRRIYTHINNTNPMLIENSSEYAQVRAAGIEVGWDGLEVTI